MLRLVLCFDYYLIRGGEKGGGVGRWGWGVGGGRGLGVRGVRGGETG